MSCSDWLSDSRSRSGEILRVAFLPNDASDVNQRDHQQRKRHRDRPKKHAPDHSDARSIADERTASVPSKQGTDKLWRDQRDGTGEDATHSRRSQRAADDVDEVSKKRHVIYRWLGPGLHSMDRPDHFERRARITNQVFRAMKSAT